MQQLSLHHYISWLVDNGQGNHFIDQVAGAIVHGLHIGRSLPRICHSLLDQAPLGIYLIFHCWGIAHQVVNPCSCNLLGIAGFWESSVSFGITLSKGVAKNALYLGHTVWHLPALAEILSWFILPGKCILFLLYITVTDERASLLRKGMPFVHSHGTLWTWVSQQHAVLWEPHNSKEIQNKCQKLSREWLRVWVLEEVGGEIPSFHTAIRLSHNLAAEKLRHGKKKKCRYVNCHPGYLGEIKK